MIIKAIRQYQNVFSRSLFATSQIKQPKYTPPASQFDTFKKHLQNINNAESRKQAAELLARLESDEEIYRESLLEIGKQFEAASKEDNLVSNLFESTTHLQEEIDNQIEENKQIENRCLKTIDHNKVYGIARISKEIIETSDHIKQAIKTVEESKAENKISQLSELTRMHSELIKVFGKYDIREFNPINQLFNPNEHESIGFIETEEVEKKNRIVEIKRSGFKLKEMLLRPAYVVIYK